jgi:tRNA threonylcarbamoyladenosine biosynthesis protein TsaB
LLEAVQAIAIGPVRIVGSGAMLLANHWPSGDVPEPFIIDARAAPDVNWVARLAGAADPERAKPRPLYLRPPDARPQDEHRLPRR